MRAGTELFGRWPGWEVVKHLWGLLETTVQTLVLFGLETVVHMLRQRSGVGFQAVK